MSNSTERMRKWREVNGQDAARRPLWYQQRLKSRIEAERIDRMVALATQRRMA